MYKCCSTHGYGGRAPIHRGVAPSDLGACKRGDIRGGSLRTVCISTNMCTHLIHHEYLVFTGTYRSMYRHPRDLVGTYLLGTYRSMTCSGSYRSVYRRPLDLRLRVSQCVHADTSGDLNRRTRNCVESATPCSCVVLDD